MLGLLPTKPVLKLVGCYTKTFELTCRSGIVPVVQSIVVNLSYWAAKKICRYRRFWPCRWIGQISYLVWRVYENRDFDMTSNGEIWCLKRLQAVNPKCIFDVGANVGDWSCLVRQYHPRATVHAFEIAPPIFAQLKSKVGNLPGVTVNDFGLSESAGEIDIYYADTANYATSAYPEYMGKMFTMPNTPVHEVRQITGKVFGGDEYAAGKGVAFIDFLKIDVEGMEGAVLRGFRQMLKEHKIRVIQFEYNTTNIVSGFLLKNACELLGEMGYKVGKIYPNYVEFRDYHYRHEDFCGPNMMAVRSEDSEIINLLGPH